jgi:hypothetical protein
MRSSVVVCLALLVGVIASCRIASGQDACDVIDQENVDRCLRINHLQFLGSHNSYHIEPDAALQQVLESIRPGWGSSWRYTHRPLAEQLAELNIRQIELDVFADPRGGLFSRPVGRRLVGASLELPDPEMLEPGYKVLHVQDIDYASTCPTLVSCLEEVRDWSLANPNHLPVMVLVEVKDGPLRDPLPDSLDYHFTVPVAVRAAELDALDAEIRSVLEPDHIITPDDVRKGHGSLEEAIHRSGWPTLAESRGRILFTLDNTGVHRDEYLRDHPDLSGRVMFTSSPPGQPTAGFIKMNDALDDEERIRSYIEAGYIVRTRADIPLHEAETGDIRRRTAALASGAQWVSTDYPEESPFGSGYIVRLPGAEYRSARCNPVSAPPGCRNDLIVE